VGAGDLGIGWLLAKSVTLVFGGDVAEAPSRGDEEGTVDANDKRRGGESPDERALVED